MGRLAVVLGSNALSPSGEDIAAVCEAHGAVVAQRHGIGAYRLPHRIDHAANLLTLAEAGCDRVLAVGSVGSLRAELAVGSLVCPDDFIALQLALTTFDDARAHTMPGFDREWRRAVLDAWPGEGTGGGAERGGVAAPAGPADAARAGRPASAAGRPASTAGGLRDGGVYWQANGPRFETPAEIRLIAAHADLVGMTLAAECVVAGELGLRYAAVCAVDNLANGVGAAPLSAAELERAREANAARLREGLDAALAGLVQ